MGTAGLPKGVASIQGPVMVLYYFPDLNDSLRCV